MLDVHKACQQRDNTSQYQISTVIFFSVNTFESFLEIPVLMPITYLKKHQLDAFLAKIEASVQS